MTGLTVSTVLATTAAGSVLATATNPNDVWSVLTGLGPVGAILVLFIWGKLRTEAEVKSLQARLDVKDTIIEHKDGQILALTQGYTDKAMPTLARAIAVLERYDEDNRGRGSP